MDELENRGVLSVWMRLVVGAVFAVCVNILWYRKIGPRLMYRGFAANTPVADFPFETLENSCHFRRSLNTRFKPQ